MIESEGDGARSYMVGWVEPAAYIDVTMSSNPSFSRTDRADTNGLGTV